LPKGDHNGQGATEIPFAQSAWFWRRRRSEKTAVKNLISFLEDRRILFNVPDFALAPQLDSSVDQIRSRCTELIGSLDAKSPAVLAARGIRAACRTFLKPHVHERKYDSTFFLALGEFRASVGLHIAALAQFYDVVVEDELATILPKPLTNDP
jgi:hypothetical protein